MNACTIATRSYLARARVLAESFLEHHPRGSFAVLLIDPDPGPLESAGEIEVLSVAELGIERRELHRMAMIYDAFEFSNALKPWLLARLLRAGRDAVAYFDADIQIFAPLDDVEALARRHSIVLTPNATEPLPRDGRVPGETSILLAGVYNGGFVAVGRGGERFLEWLSERLARECLVAPERALFVDQRWLDLVPGLFDHVLLRDPTCNVAYWNLPSREVIWTGERYEVNAQPLRFFHFSGFDPADPFLLSRFQGDSPRILLSERPALARLCREYAERLAACGHEPGEDRTYAFGALPTGVPVDRRMRSLYREALVESEQDGRPEPPDPFDATSADAFVAWLGEPGDRRRSGASISRYLHALWRERPDLQARFPDVLGVDAAPYLGWLAGEGERAGVPVALLPQPARPEPAQARGELLPGVNLAGYLGRGPDAETPWLLRSLELAGVQVATVDASSARGAGARADDTERVRAAPYDTNVIRLNAGEILSFGNDAGPDLFEGRHSIGIWTWPLAHVPADLRDAVTLFHELWVPSAFAARALAGAPRPVLTFPLPVEAPDLPPTTRAELGLPEGFLFLFLFDAGSGFERKNPLALVDAFGRAFSPGEGPALVIACAGGECDLAQLERLRGAAAAHPDVLLAERGLGPDERAALLAACDCYVSLHRAEWFGLTIAEAMARGKPVIATGHSGNLEYMDDETSYLVAHRTERVPTGCDPLPAGAEWADPDLDEAARLMRHVYESPAEAQAKGRRGRERILEAHSLERTASFLAARLAEIRRQRTTPPLDQPVTPDPLPEPEQREQEPTGLERAARYLEEGPANPWTAPSRLGVAGRLARHLLRRVIRPYAIRQLEFDAALVEALRESAAGLSEHLGRLELGPLHLADVLSGDDVVEVEAVIGTLWSHRNDPFITACLAEHGAWEPDVAAFLEKSLRPGMTFVDVGANLGYFSIMASRLVGRRGTVVAVEPLPDNVALLRANLWRHRCGNVLVLPIAAYSNTGHVRIMRNDENPGGSWVERDATGGTLAPCARLDDLFAERRVDVVKVDAEGADHAAVRGMEGIVRRNPEIAIVVEFWSRVADLHGARPIDVLAYYQSLGFDLFLLGADGEIQRTTPDGVFAAADPVQGIVNVVLRR